MLTSINFYCILETFPHGGIFFIFLFYWNYACILPFYSQKCCCFVSRVKQCITPIIKRGDNHSIIDRGDNHSIIDRGDNTNIIDRGDNHSIIDRGDNTSISLNQLI
jgi:hypothetical protein